MTPESDLREIPPDREKGSLGNNPRRLIVAFGGSVALAFAFLSACGGGKEGVVQEPVGGTAPNVPTAELKIEQQPSATAVVPEVTATVAQPEVMPTAEIPTSTSTKSEQEKVSNWAIEIDPKLAGVVQDRIDKDIAIIQSIIEKLPQIGNLKIRLTSGHVSQFDIDKQELIISRDYEHFVEASESFPIAVAHEAWHYLDPELNGEYLSKFISEANFAEYKALREKLLSDKIWGRDYPSLEAIFTLDRPSIGHALSVKKSYSQGQLASWSDIYPDAVWIAQRRFNGVEAKNPFKIVLSQELNLIGKYAQEQEAFRRVDLTTIFEFLDMPEVKTKVDPMVAKNPILSKAMELLMAQKAILGAHNIVRSGAAPVNAKLEGRNMGDWWEALPNYFHLVLAEAVLGENQEVIKLFNPAALEAVKFNLRQLQKEADEEKFAEVGVATTLFGAETPLSPASRGLLTR